MSLEPDLVLDNCQVLDPFAGRVVASSLAVLGGRIVALDHPPAGRTVDLEGACVTAGFDDAHNHMAWFGLAMDEVDLTDASSHEQVADALAERAASTEPGQLIVGNGYDHNQVGGHPDRTLLDRATGGREVWLKHRSGHMCVVSSALLQRIGVLDGRVDAPEGGRVVRDASGAPTGLLQEQAQNLVTALVTPYSTRELADAIGRASRQYSAEGLTHVTECGIGAGWIGKSPIELAAYSIARERGELSVRADLMPCVSALHSLSGHAEDDVTFGVDLGVRTGFGDDRLRIGAMKIWLDGSLIGRTAAMREDYCPCGSANPPAGYLQDDPAVMRRQILQAHRSGWTVAAHAIGDAAIDFALDCFAEAQQLLPRPSVRHRIEHAAVLSDAQIARMVQLGVSPVPQYRFLYEFGDAFVEALGPERSKLVYRHRSLLEAGARVAGSSDRPVSLGSPLLGMASMLDRKSSTGQVLDASESVDALTALRAYTLDSAWLAGDESLRGRTAPGYLADLVVLQRSPLECSADELRELQVQATLVGGEATYDRDGRFGCTSTGSATDPLRQ